MFSSYPDEWPGVGLLLLRVANAVVVMVRASSSLAGWHELKFMTMAIALLAGGAVLVLTGYYTRVGAILVALTSMCSMIGWSSPTIGFFESRLTAALVAVIASALVCLGPVVLSMLGSLDARKSFSPKPPPNK